MDLLPLAISIAGLPLNLGTIVTVCSKGRIDRASPFYVNLLFADLFLLCCVVLLETLTEWQTIQIVSFTFDFAVGVHVSFMVCAALERYLIVTCPLWCQSHRTVKKTVAVCVLVWVLPAVSVLFFYFWVDFEVLFIFYSAFLLLPLPLLMYLLDGIVKALVASSSVPSAEKRRIVGVLVPELLIYSLLFLPRAFWLLTHGDTYGDAFDKVSILLVKLSPLADVALYFFMRKGPTDEHLATVSENDCNIVTVSCTDMERKQRGSEQQGHCGLRNPLWFLHPSVDLHTAANAPAVTQPPLSPPNNGSSTVTYVLVDPLSIERYAERRALLPMNTTPGE